MVPLSDDGDLSAGDALAQHAANASLLAIEVGFEAVSDGFVQENARPAGAENDFHYSLGGSFTRVELDDAWRAASLAKCSGVFSV